VRRDAISTLVYVLSIVFVMHVVAGCSVLEKRKQESVLEQLRTDALSGDAVAQLELGNLHNRGLTVVRNDELALYWYRLAALQGSAEGAFRTARLLVSQSPKHDDEVVAMFERAVNADFIEAHLAYANFLSSKEDTDTDVRVFELLLASAKHNVREAQYRVAELYTAGKGTPVDLRSALDWYRRAADQGDQKAQLVVGDFYLSGVVVTADASRALSWYERAAVQGSSQAQSNLGDLLTLDRYSPLRNFKIGAEWYAKSAKQGHAHARTRLASLYENGTGVSQDLQMAADLYFAAAQSGHASAECRLGSLYLRGRGVPQSRAEAERWFSLAAAQIPAGVAPVLGLIYYDCDQFDQING